MVDRHAFWAALDAEDSRQVLGTVRLDFTGVFQEEKKRSSSLRRWCSTPERGSWCRGLLGLTATAVVKPLTSQDECLVPPP